MRTMQNWLDSYSGDHQNPINQRLHWICVPPIVWSVIALLWTVPVPAEFARQGAWAVLAIVLSFFWYWKHSHRLGMTLLLAFAVLALISAGLFNLLGAANLRWLAVAVFVVAWVGQFIGHKYEGRRPSFLTDLSYLLIGPAWLMEKLLRKLGMKAAA
ncbi:MAG: Mpo1-like protein [Rhodanobacter sp.]